MRIQQFFITLFLCVLLISCKNNEAERLKTFFTDLSVGVELHPDSVIQVLDSVKAITHLDEMNMARWNLLYIRAVEEGTFTLPSDSIVMQTTDILRAKGNLKEKAYSYFYLARMCTDKQDNNEALEAYLQAFDLAKHIKEYRLAGLVGRYIAEIYNNMNLYDKAIDILKQSEFLFYLSHNGRTRALAVMEIGKSFMFKSVPDSALVYFSKAESLARQINDKDLLSRIYHLLGMTYNNGLDDEKAAEYYLKEALEWQKDSTLMIQGYLSLGFVYSKQKLYEQAKNCYLHCLENENIASPEMRASMYLGLKEAEYGLRNYEKAVSWADKYSTVCDSITSAHLEANAMKAELDYKAKKLLYENNKLQKEKQDGFSIVMVLILIAAIGICVYQRHVINQNKKIKDQRDKLLELTRKEAELSEKVLQGYEVTQKIALLSQTLPHKQKDLKEKMEELFNNSDIKDKDWAELEEIVNEMLNGFAGRLREKFNRLSEDEIHCVLLIRIGLDNFQLSNIFNIQKSSIMTKRHRIRKKMGLEEDVNLDNYIKKLFGK